MSDFVRLVAEMRDAQKRFFKDRKQSTLTESKRLEREVDAFIARNPVDGWQQEGLPE